MSRPYSSMRLYNDRHERLYLNALELEAFIDAAKHAPGPQRRFALTLVYTGCRLSEARYLCGQSMQLDAGVVSIVSLKKRDKRNVREVPVPPELAQEFERLRLVDDQLIWAENNRPLPRITAYRWIKVLMACANITGARASPKGLRHAFAARATGAGIPMHMVQKWMGHASMETTAIYATLAGPEQHALIQKMWR